jgi:hypothetical protein
VSPRGAQFYAYPWDLADEGVDEASGAIARATGPGGGVLLALSYHVSTYFSPHNPLRKLYYGEEGAVYFVPDESLYADTAMRPLVSKVVTGTDYMKDLARGIGRNGLGFEAWSVYFYNHHLPQAFPDVARRDCFGQPYLAQVCPAGPDARRYAVALTRDMLRHGPAAIQLESLSYLPFRYGFRNPKILVDIAPYHEFLMGLCFCPYCVSAAHRAGVDGEGLRRDVAAYLDRELRRDPSAEMLHADLSEPIDGAFDNRLTAFLEVRVETATSLFEQVAGTVHDAGADVTFFGSLEGRVTGLDKDRVRRCIDAVYTRIPGAIDEAQQQVQRLRQGLPAGVRLISIAAPGSCVSDTRDTLEAQAAAGVDGFAFYTYGLLRQTQIDWIGACRDVWG